MRLAAIFLCCHAGLLFSQTINGVPNQSVTGVAPSGSAGGVLAGTYPNPGLANPVNGDLNLLGDTLAITFQVAGTTPSSVSSGSGTNAQNLISATAPAGGNTTDASSSISTGGTGGNESITSGGGGSSASTSASGSGLNRGGNGGGFSVITGAGGQATAVTGATKGGNGGPFSLVSGNGGSSSSATGAGGAAGTYQLQGGSGGSATGTSNNGGIGAAIAITGGNGGSSTNGTGGAAGNVTVDAGLGGTGGGGNGANGQVQIGPTQASQVTLGASAIPTVALGSFKATTYLTATNYASGASPAVCGSAAAGHIAVPTGVNPTLVVNTSAITSNSEIMLTGDDTVGSLLSVTCNSTLATIAGGWVVTGRTGGTSFTITYNGTITANPLCLGYTITN